MLINGEEIIGSYKAMRDYCVFTNKRVIAVNVQGMTGKKKDFTSLPYSKVSAYSVETAGVLDLDSELEMYLPRQPIGCIPPFPSLVEGVVDMSTYEEFMIILTACSLLVAILNFTHRK